MSLLLLLPEPFEAGTDWTVLLFFEEVFGLLTFNLYAFLSKSVPWVLVAISQWW